MTEYGMLRQIFIKTEKFQRCAGKYIRLLAGYRWSVAAAAWIFLLVGGAAAAGANSYIEMITTPPPDQLEQRAAVAVAAEKAGVWPQQTAERPNIGSTYLPTVSPVVVPPYHKYAAWQKAQANGGYYPYQDNVQNLIYFLGGVVAGRVAYDIWGPYHRHHLLDHW